MSASTKKVENRKTKKTAATPKKPKESNRKPALVYKIEIPEIMEATPKFKTHMRPFFNYLNKSVQGTIPKVVGELSVIFPEYLRQTKAPSIAGWKEWYSKKYPGKIDQSIEKIQHFLDEYFKKEILPTITKEIIGEWVEDLVITKTYQGLLYQKFILEKIANNKKANWKSSTPEEESRGIDGYIGDEPVSIKPISYKMKPELMEKIEVPIIFYEIKNNKIIITSDNYQITSLPPE